MTRTKKFTFRVNHYERKLIAALAKRFQRTQSDAVRWLISQTALELGLDVSSSEDQTDRLEVNGTNNETPPQLNK